MIKTILRKLKVVRRPQISMPLLTFAIIAGWMLYTIAPAALSYDTIRAEQNLLSNPSFEQWEGNTPKDWVISHPDSASAETLRVEGFIDGSGLRLDIVDYKGGNIVLTSPNVKVDTNTEYFFKSFYETDTFLDLMLITTNQDGSTDQKILRNYPDYDYPWSSMG